MIPIEITEALEQLKAVYIKGETQAYWDELNKFAGILLEEKYTASNMIDSFNLLFEHYKLPVSQVLAPNTGILFRKYKNELNSYFKNDRIDHDTVSEPLSASHILPQTTEADSTTFKLKVSYRVDGFYDNSTVAANSIEHALEQARKQHSSPLEILSVERVS